MNREDIIRMAQEAGMDYLQHISPEAFEKVVIFAALVRAEERKDIIELASDLYYWDHSEALIKAIRARGNS